MVPSTCHVIELGIVYHISYHPPAWMIGGKVRHARACKHEEGCLLNKWSSARACKT